MCVVFRTSNRLCSPANTCNLAVTQKSARQSKTLLDCPLTAEMQRLELMASSPSTFHHLLQWPSHGGELTVALQQMELRNSWWKSWARQSVQGHGLEFLRWGFIS